MDSSDISVIHTSCKNCIFAVYNGKTQIDCAADQLVKFKKHKVDIIEAYDDDNEFFIIDKRVCRLARSEKWKSKQGQNIDIKTLFDKAKKEANISYQIVVIVNDDLKKFKQTVKSISSQKLLPTMVSFIREFTCKAKPTEFITILRENAKFKWKIENLLDNVSIIEGIDLAIRSSANTTFYGVFNVGHKIPANTFSMINKKVNDDLFEFAVIEPNSEGNGLIVLRHFHNLVYGNKQKSVLEKAKEENIECPKIYEVITSYPK